MSATLSDQAAATCESPDYHVVDRIQPHAVLAVAEWPSLTLLHLSENAARVFGETAREMLGTSLAERIDAHSLARLRLVAGGVDAMSLSMKPQALDGLHLRSAISDGPCLVDTWVHGVGTKLCLEFFIPTAGQLPSELSEFEFSVMLADIASYEGAGRDLATQVCHSIFRLTEFDRVYLCEFDGIGDGYVSAEALHGHFPSLLEHRFPSTDIPQKARQLYVSNRFRLIPDSSAEPSAILALPGIPTRLDLSSSTCREIGPTHLLYLRNMGVVASTSFSIVNAGRLTAMFGAHHHESRQLSYRQLLRCARLVESFANRATVLRLLQQQERLISRHAQVQAHAEAFVTAGCDVPTFAATSGSNLAAVFEADTVIARDGERIHAGELTEPQARQLLSWCASQLEARGLVCTAELSRDHPEFTTFRDKASGVYVVVLDKAARRMIVLIKREVLCVRKWAGDPRRVIGPSSSGALEPRHSFQTYLEKVEGTSPAWDEHCADLARALRYVLNQALTSEVLRESIAERTAELRLANLALEHSVTTLRAREEENRQLALVAQKTNAIVIVMDASGCVQWINQAFTTLFGYTLGEVVGKRLAAVTHGPDTEPTAAAMFRQACERGDDFDVEILSYARDGRPLWVEIIGTAVREENGVVRSLIAVAHDMTLRKREQQRLVEALSSERAAAALQRRFISIASHEFRTPLAVIDSAMQRLNVQLGDQHSAAEKHVNRVRAAVVRMIEVIDRTLSSARLEEGRIELKPQHIDLNGALTEICSRQRQIAPLFDIRLSLPEEKVVIDADPYLLDQVFSNLLSNAVKYSGVSRRVDISVALQSGNVEIAVRDSGIGISADEVSQLFTRFFRARSATGLPGTGIGLHLVRELLALHGGTISVESELGRGSTFTARLPERLLVACSNAIVAA